MCCEDGRLTDSKGRVVSFKNALIIMTLGKPCSFWSYNLVWYSNYVLALLPVQVLSRLVFRAAWLQNKRVLTGPGKHSFVDHKYLSLML